MPILLWLRAATVGVCVVASVAACAHHPRRPATIVHVGPDQPPPPEAFADLVNDPQLPVVVEGRVDRVGPVAWHDGNIRYPYSLVDVVVSRSWRHRSITRIAVRIFGGFDGSTKYVSAIQPDPATLTPGLQVLLFLSVPTSIDPGVIASTVEDFFYVDGARLLRFDRTPADVGTTQAITLLDHRDSVATR